MSIVNRHSSIHTSVPALSSEEIRKYKLLTHPSISDNLLLRLATRNVDLHWKYKAFLRLHVLGLSSANLEFLIHHQPTNFEGINHSIHAISRDSAASTRSDFRLLHQSIFNEFPQLSGQLPIRVRDQIFCTSCGQEGHSNLFCHLLLCQHCQHIAPGHLPSDCPEKEDSPLTENSTAVDEIEEDSDPEDSTFSSTLSSTFLARGGRRTSTLRSLFPSTSSESSVPSQTIRVQRNSTTNSNHFHPLSSTRGASAARRRSRRLEERDRQVRFQNPELQSPVQTTTTSINHRQELGEESLVLEERTTGEGSGTTDVDPLSNNTQGEQVVDTN